MMRRHQWLWVAGRVAAICGFVLVSGTSMVWADGGRRWVCKAEGVYRTCEPTRAWRVCQEHRLAGVGIARDRTSACIEAEQTCSDNLLRALILDRREGGATIKSRCAMTTCEIDAAGEPASPKFSQQF